ncbi:MAG TPA: PepSY domain-containing protein [Terricaulis sp.]|nr:PepSY domain-containing protein [Terricaulis sp.]
MLKQTAFAAAIVAVAALAMPAFAQSQSQAGGDRLSIAQIDQRLSAQGYRVLEIEWDDGEYEVQAFNAQNQCRELDVNARTGQVRRDRADDDCWDDDRRNAR